MERLPPSLRSAKLLALQAEGHYVRAITDAGSELVLHRLKDAMEEVGAVNGMQVHRSWWIAKEAVRKSKRENGRLWLHLVTGDKVPVSRPNVQVLKESGWIR